MLGSLKLLIIFVIGIMIGLFSTIPSWLNISTISEIALYGLVFFIGVSLSQSQGVVEVVKKYHIKLFLIPLMIVLGSFFGSILIGLCFPDISVQHSCGVAAGLGYYSLSSILITKMGYIEIGAIALLANIFREFITILTVPILVKIGGSFAPIASAGVTAMDTALAPIVKSTNKSIALISVFCGVVLSILVPILVELVYADFWK